MNNHDQYNPFLQSDPEPSDSDAEDIPDTLPTQTHIVTFKCVGSIHDVCRQVVLSRISKILCDGGIFDARIHPEPENQYRAITFQCHIEQEWQTIGYIVRECLDHVHEALQKKGILSVKLAWAKYLVCWSRSGPGFYAAINISLNGEWHRDVIRSQTTR